MRMNKGVEWAVHACALLAPLGAGRGLSLAALADYHGVPLPYMAKQMQLLSKAGLTREELADAAASMSALAAPRTDYVLNSNDSYWLANAFVGLGLPRARVAVCGLNPHAGEGGQIALNVKYLGEALAVMGTPQVAFEMVHRQRRALQGRGECRGKGRSHQQRTRQPWAGGIGHTLHCAQVASGIGDGARPRRVVGPHQPEDGGVEITQLGFGCNDRG